MQIAVDDLVPFPVVVDRLHCQGDEDQSPKTEMEIGKANIGGADADDAEEDEAEGIGQLKSIACMRFRRGCRAGDPPRMMASSQNL